jgi:putative NIF3 family GTP cyclohydrolase 1 type 2
LLNDALAAKADVFITADVKYHQFFDAENLIVIADVGHFESEQFTVDIFYDLLSKKLPNFAILKSDVRTNPINYI